jgi:hypothetical protein
LSIKPKITYLYFLPPPPLPQNILQQHILIKKLSSVHITVLFLR